MTLTHGGNLHTIAANSDIPLEDWLDLSTGISPFSYPIPHIPEYIWRELPQSDSKLIQAATTYYQTAEFLPVSGSQSAINLLPGYRQACGNPISKVWLPIQGYKEHEKAWRQAGYTICHYQSLPDKSELNQHDILVAINPNNPTGALHTRDTLLGLQQELQSKNGWLIVDEAFMDVIEADVSMVYKQHPDNLFIMRSMGKFFGLAGIRIGFLMASQTHLNAMQNLLGPWHVNGPAQYVAGVALADKKWQQQQRVSLKSLAEQLDKLLTAAFQPPPKGTNLFRTVYLNSAEETFKQLLSSGVYVRLTDEKDALRFGIPRDEDLTRLRDVLSKVVN